MSSDETWAKARRALRLFPACAGVWERIHDLLPQFPFDVTPEDLNWIDEALGKDQDTMVVFLEHMIPRATHPDIWAYPDMAHFKGTPVVESDADRENRLAKARVGKNPLYHVYPALKDDVYARSLAAAVAEVVIATKRKCTVETESGAEAHEDSLGELPDGLTPRRIRVLRTIRDMAPVSDEGIADELGLTKDVVNDETGPMHQAGFIAQARGKKDGKSVQGWCLTAVGLRSIPPSTR